jgi:hypothetical protein
VGLGGGQKRERRRAPLLCLTDAKQSYWPPGDQIRCIILTTAILYFFAILISYDDIRRKTGITNLS